MLDVNKFINPDPSGRATSKPKPQRRTVKPRKRLRTDLSGDSIVSEDDTPLFTHTQTIGTSPITSERDVSDVFNAKSAKKSIKPNSSVSFWNDQSCTTFDPPQNWTGDGWLPSSPSSTHTVHMDLDTQSTSNDSTVEVNIPPRLFTYKPLSANNSGTTAITQKSLPKMTIQLDTDNSNHNLNKRSVFLQDPNVNADNGAEDPGTPAPRAPGYTATVTQPSSNPPAATGILAAANHLNKTKTSTPSGQMQKQAYFAHILPQALETWRNYRTHAQKGSFAIVKASYLRHMATSGKFPAWSVSFHPPAGIIQTPVDAMKLVNIRRDFAVTGLNTVASILDDKAADCLKKADEAKAQLKSRYDEQTTTFGLSPPYRYEDAKELAVKLIERETSSLNQRLHTEEARLSTCPDAPLWIGVPMSLVPGNIVGLAQKKRNFNNR